MNSLYSTYNYNARLDRITIDRNSEPIKNEATLRLTKTNIPAKDDAFPSDCQHLLEVHIDGRLLVRTINPRIIIQERVTERLKARWDLNQLTRPALGAIPGLIARSFSSFRLERIIQLVLPLPMPDEAENIAIDIQAKPVCHYLVDEIPLKLTVAL